MDSSPYETNHALTKMAKPLKARNYRIQLTWRGGENMTEEKQYICPKCGAQMKPNKHGANDGARYCTNCKGTFFNPDSMFGVT